MKTKSMFLLLGVLVFIIVTAVGRAMADEDVTVIDTSDPNLHIYKHVDLIINYGWGDPETVDNTTAHLVFKGKELEKVIIHHADGSQTHVFIRGDVQVRIYSRPHKQLIKILESVPQEKLS